MWARLRELADHSPALKTLLPSARRWVPCGYALALSAQECVASVCVRLRVCAAEDGMSSLFCLYDGIPLWVVNKRTPPQHPFPYPLSGDCTRGWETNFFAEAVGEAYQDLYNNHNGMADDMVNFWAKSASVFANNSNIIAYELINEPWCGDIYKVGSTASAPGGPSAAPAAWEAEWAAVRPGVGRGVLCTTSPCRVPVAVLARVVVRASWLAGCVCLVGECFTGPLAVCARHRGGPKPHATVQQPHQGHSCGG
jgi:hypothetical protein